MKRMVLISENDYNKFKILKTSTTPEDITKLAPDQEQKLAVSNMIEEKLTHVAPEKLPKLERLSLDLIKTSIAKFPMNRRMKALKILQIIDQSKDYSWDERGQIIAANNVVPASNIIDILYFATNTDKQLLSQPMPTGWKEVVTLIKPEISKTTTRRKVLSKPTKKRKIATPLEWVSL